MVTSVQENSIATGNTRDGRLEISVGGSKRAGGSFCRAKDGKKYGASVARPERRQKSCSR